MINIIYVGRFAEQKNNLAIIGIAKELALLYEDFSIDVYGDAEPTDPVGQTIKREFLQHQSEINQISVKGFSNNINDLLPAYDFLILPSLWEGYPLVMIEAASRGCIPICSDIKTGPREFIADVLSYGYVLDYPCISDGGILLECPKDDASYKRWAKIIYEIYADKDKLFKLKKSVVDRSSLFNLDNYFKQWDDFIETI